eukprot:9360455-Lingulodinium_polyedra.AAC.1
MAIVICNTRYFRRARRPPALPDAGSTRAGKNVGRVWGRPTRARPTCPMAPPGAADPWERRAGGRRCLAGPARKLRALGQALRTLMACCPGR